MFSPEEIREANERGAERLEREPRVVSAKFDARLRRIILVLTTNAWFSFSPHDAQGLESATDAQLRKIEIGPYGLDIDFPLLDVQFELVALMQGHFGSTKWMAKHVRAASSSVRSKATPTPTLAKGDRRVRRKTAAIQ